MGSKQKESHRTRSDAFRGHAGVATWKLLVIAGVAVFAAAFGAYSIQSVKANQSHGEHVFDFGDVASGEKTADARRH